MCRHQTRPTGRRIPTLTPDCADAATTFPMVHARRPGRISRHSAQDTFAATMLTRAGVAVEVRTTEQWTDPSPVKFFAPLRIVHGRSRIARTTAAWLASVCADCAPDRRAERLRNAVRGIE